MSPRTVLRLHFEDEPHDQWYPQTALLLLMEGTLEDRSPAAHPMQLLGDAAITSTRSLFGTTAYEATTTNAANGCETVDSTFSYNPATESLTVDVDVWPTALGTAQSFLRIPGVVDLGVSASGLLQWAMGGNSPQTNSAFPLVANAWNRVRMQLGVAPSLNQDLRVLLNGASVVFGGGVFVPSPITNAKIFVGRGSGAPFVGGIAQARVTKALRDEGLLDSYMVLPFAYPTGFNPNPEDGSCARPKVVTLTGAASPAPSEKRFCSRSLYIPRRPSGDTNTAGMVVSADSDFAFGAADWTLRAWVWRFSHARPAQVFLGTVSGQPFSLRLGLGSGQPQINVASSGGVGSAVPALGVEVPVQTWRQLLVQRRGPAFEVYLQGTLVMSLGVPGGGAATVNFDGPLYFGRTDGASADALNGYLDEVSIVRGIALASGNFTPPETPDCDANGIDFWPAGAHVWPAGSPQ